MLRPRIQAPTLAKPRCANASSMPVVPPSCPNIVLKVRVGKNHPNRPGPPTPSGFSRLWSGPAPNPSMETPNACTRTLLMDEPLLSRFHELLEPAPEHAHRIERHGLRIHRGQARVLHHQGVDAVALRARLEHDPGEHDRLVRLELHRLWERRHLPWLH